MNNLVYSYKDTRTSIQHKSIILSCLSFTFHPLFCALYISIFISTIYSFIYRISFTTIFEFQHYILLLSLLDIEKVGVCIWVEIKLPNPPLPAMVFRKGENDSRY